MASVSEELRKRVYGSSSPSQSQINSVQKKANTLTKSGQKVLDRYNERKQQKTTVTAPSKTSNQPFWKTWFLDTGTNDQVIDSTTGQVIQVNKPSALGGAVKGGVKSTAAGFTNLGSTLLDLVNQGVDTAETYSSDYASRQADRAAEMLRTGRTTDGKALTPAMRETLQQNVQKYQQQAAEGPTETFAERHPVLNAVQNTVQDTADTLAVSSQQDIDQAKEGMGTVGNFLVDAGVAGTQLAGDIGLALLTGGSALVPMAARAFGSGAQEARLSGADLENQLAYGLGSAALSAATEKISNVAAPFRKVFGEGVADKLAGKLVNRFGENAAVQAMSKLSQTSAGRLAASALGEGSEEFVEDVFQPVLQRATYDQSATFDLGQALYDAAIGATLGGLGGAVEIAGRNTGSDAQATTAPVQSVEANTAGVDAPAAETPTQATVRPPVQTAAAQDVMVQEAQRLNTQAQTQTAPQPDPLLSALLGGKRVDQSQASNEEFAALADRGDIGVDAKGKLYQMDPAQHIDQRNQQNVRGRNVNAFQFDHPELQPYMKQAAESLIADADLSLQFPMTRSYERTLQGNRVNQSAQTSGSLRAAMNETGLSRNQIIDAAQRIINDQGQENVAAAKSVELILDNMLSQGYTTMYGESVAPNEAYVNAKESITGAAPAAESEPLPIWDMPEAQTDGLGAADSGFTTRGMEGQEQTSRLSDSMPYNQYQESATGMTREEYAKLFRYQSQTEAKSLHLAEEMLYVMQNGQRVFLKDVDAAQFQELVKSLDDATAWNGPQMDAAHMIQSELQGRSVNSEIESEEYVNFLRIMREHETATGQGVQANAKYSRADNGNGQATELDAWDNLQNAKGMSDQEKMDTFRRIVKWDKDIEAVQPGDTQSMKDIILDVARTRGTLSGLTGRQSRILTAIADKSLNSMTFDQLKQFAYSSTSALSTDSNPVGVGQKIKTIQILNMLSSPTTTARNLTGNASFYGIDALAMKGASILDMALSKLTGTRSVAYERTNREMVNSAVKAMQMSIAEITMDVDMDSGESRYGTGSNRTFKSSGNFVDRIFSALERNQAYLLNATDEFFKGAARSTERSTQNLVNQGKIKTESKDYAKNQAEQLSKYRTFQDDSALSVAIQQLHDVLNILPGIGDSGRTIKGKLVHQFGVGDIVAPFTRVAGNLASRGVEYSPVNAVKGVTEMVGAVANAAKGNVDAAAQAKAVSDTARGLTGSAIAYGFMQLALAGILRRSDDEGDEDVRALNQSEGINGSQLNLSAAQRWLKGKSTQWQTGDTLVDLSSIEPLNLLLDMGAIMAEDSSSGIIKAWDATSGAFMTATSDLPVMQSIGNAATDIIKYGQDPEEVLAQEAANTIVSSVTPNILRAAAEGTDDRPRYTYSGDTLLEQIVDNFKNRVPGLRQTLPGSVNPMGEEKTYQGDQTDIFLNALLNPIDVTNYQQSGVSSILEQARRETGGDTSFYPSKTAPTKLESGNITRHLSYQERQDYLRRRGEVMTSAVTDMAKISAYRDSTPEEKSKLLNQCLDYSSQMAKRSFLGDGSVDKWVLNASTAQQDIGVSPAEYIALYQKYGSNYMSGNGYEKTKEAVKKGFTVDEYVTARTSANTNGKSGVNKEEATTYVNQSGLTGQKKVDLWDLICTTSDNNPFR